MRRIGTIIVVGTVLGSVLFLLGLSAAEPDDRASELRARIDSLRMDSKFDEALEASKQLLDIRRGDDSSRPFEVAEAELLVSTLKLILDSPIATRQELAEAYKLEVIQGEHYDKAEYQKGAAAAERQLRIFRKALGNEHPDVARSLRNIGSQLLGQRDYAAAEPLYQEALSISREALGGDHPDVADNLNGLGNLLQSQGDYTGAEPFYREALSIYRRAYGNEHAYVATALNNLGYLLRNQGDYAGAETLSREALAIRRKSFGNEHPTVANSLNTLGQILGDQGDYAGAETIQREALAINRKAIGNEHPAVAMSLNNLAIVLEALGNYAEAEALHREALAIKRKTFGNDHRSVAMSLDNLGALLDNRGDYKAAELLFREALSIRRKVLGNEHPDVATSLSNLAVLLYGQGDYPGAEAYCREALAIRRKALGNDHPSVLASAFDLGALLHAKGDYAGAERELSQAAVAYDASRLRAGTGIKRATFKRSPYAALAAVRLEMGRTDEAWPAAERYLGRALADLLLSGESRSLTKTEAAREDSLQRALGNLERELMAYQKASLTDTTDKASESLDAVRNRLTATEAEWATFQAEIRKKYPISEGHTYQLEEVQAALDNETAILGWLDVEGGKDHYKSWAYVVRARGPVIWAHLEGSDEGTKASALERMLVFRDRLSSHRSGTQSAIRTAKECWHRRIEPVSDALDGIKQLVVIPSGPMLGVPVEVLVDDEGRYLGDRFILSYIPSATIYTWLEGRSDRGDRIASDQSLLLGDPPFREAHLLAMESEEDLDEKCLAPGETNIAVAELRSVLAGNEEACSSLQRLPCTRLEVEMVARVLSLPTLLVGAKASEPELCRLAELGQLHDYRVLHFATHAFVDPENADRSALVLSLVNLPDPLEAAMAGTRIYDGMIRAKEIVREWKLDADLVTLSACETGLGKVVGGEGYVGFAQALLQAGARSLLVSLWKVEDRATSLLMRRFYENWMGEYTDVRQGHVRRAMSKVEALQEAKQYLRTYTDEHGERPFEHPYFWSAFVLIGDRG